MKTCNRCHSENFEDIRFCNFCGFRLPMRLDTGLAGQNAPYVVGNAVPNPAPVAVGNPRQAYAYFLKGRKLLAVGDVETAIVVFQKALEADPGDPQIRQLLKRAVRMRKVAARHGAQAQGGEAAVAAVEKPAIRPAVSLASVAVPAVPAAPTVTPPATPVQNRQPRNETVGLAATDSRLVVPAQTRGNARKRFFETLQPSLQYRPSTLIDQADGSIWREVAVTALIVFGMFAFGYLLVF